MPFEQVFNFRDLGGYHSADGHMVRWRTLFRADGVHRLTIDDIAPLGVRTVLDLRTPGELEERGRFTHDSVGYHHLPILESTWDREVLDVEVDAPTVPGRPLPRDDRTRAATPSPARCASSPTPTRCLWCSIAPRARTVRASIAAIVLDLLGVSDDDIAGDYSLSRLGMDRFRAWIIETYPGAADAMSDQPQAFLDAPTEAMHLFLAGLRARHGSVHEYVASLGVP